MTLPLPGICFVAPNAYPLLAGDEQTALIGGAELQQVFIAKGLAERGYTISMICLDFGQQAKIEIDGVTVFRAFKHDKGIPILRFVWPRLTSIWSCLKRANAECYYQRSAGMLTGIVAEYCRRNHKKSVFAAAGNPDLDPNTSRIQYSRDRYIYEYGLRHVDRILVQNEEQARLCRLNFKRESTLIPNCYPNTFNQSADAECSILWVSTIRQLKQPELFLDIAEALPDYRFKMIGGPGRGEAALFDSIQSRASTISNIDFLGFVPFSKIDEYFDEAFVFVNTSESEGFPNTFLQAWARSVPTVAFIDSGARSDGHPVGHLATTTSQLVECIDHWLTNTSDRLQEGAICLKYFEKNHTLERVLDLYEKIFDDLVNRKPV